MKRTYGPAGGRPTAFESGSIGDSSHCGGDRPRLSRKWAPLLMEAPETGLVFANDGTTISNGAALPV
jgi:hypothetical protein